MSPNPATTTTTEPTTDSSTSSQTKSGIDLNGISADPYFMDSLTENKDKQDDPDSLKEIEGMTEKEKEDEDLHEKSVEVEDVNMEDLEDEDEDFDFDISVEKDGLKDEGIQDVSKEETGTKENETESAPCPENNKGLETSSKEETGTTENIPDLETGEKAEDGLDPVAVTSENVNPPTDDNIPDADEKQQAEKVRERHLKQDAELEAYLESLKPKPKRKTIKDRLMSMPGFKDVASLKPKIGGGFEKEVIFLDDESFKKESAKDLKRRQQIEELKERFVRQVIVAPAKPQKDHIKLKIKKKEEDSQGLEHLVEDEVEYVRNTLNEEEDAMGFLSAPQNESPKANAPGIQRRYLRDKLLAQIRAQKKKEHEERLKNHAMDNDEIDMDEKEESEEEEAEDSSEESELGEDEEELEDLLDGSEKKKKKKCKYVEDEAEDEDDDDGDDDDDDDDDDTDEDVEEDSASAKNIDGEGSVPVEGSKDFEDSESSKPENAENSEGSKYDLVDSPLVVIPRVDAWSRSKQSEKDALWSPLLNVLKNSRSEEMDRSGEPADTNKVPESLSTVITNTENNFGNLADLCSGRFVSQVDTAHLDSQEEDEYAGFDFGDDDDVVTEDKNKETDEIVKTPIAAANASRTAVDGITPKLSEKISKTRLLMQFDEEAEKGGSKPDVMEAETYEMGASQENDGCDADNDEEDDLILTRTRVMRKKKRLQFSDDEDDDADALDGGDGSNGNQTESDDGDVTEEEEMEEEVITPVEPAKSNPFFNKFGRLKRKFVEDEAELSGSDEGSADEDEKGLNHYEMDEADEEELDEDEVRQEVGRAHLQRLLDEDEKDIRELQVAYLENGDLHKDKQRERKFRWMNINDMDDDAVMGASDDEPDQDENPEELEKKREWIEKRKWMSENSHLLETDEDESQSLFNNSKFLKISKTTLKKIESFVDTSTSDSTKDGIIKESSVQRRSILDEIIKAKKETKKSMTALTSCSEGMGLETDNGQKNSDMANKSMSQPFFGLGELSWTKKPTITNLKKGSFLSRGGMLLSKLAETTKSNDAVSNIKVNSRNFVFSHITPPNPDKTDGSTSRVKRMPNQSKAGCGMQAKKAKIDRSFNVLDESSKGSIFKHFSK